MTKRISLLDWPSMRNWKSMGDEKALCNKLPLQATDSMIECTHTQRNCLWLFSHTHKEWGLFPGTLLWLVGSISINSWLAANNNSRGCVCVCEVWVFVIGWLVADRLEDTYWCVLFPSSQTERERDASFQWPWTVAMCLTRIFPEYDIIDVRQRKKPWFFHFYLLGPCCCSASFERLSCCVGCWSLCIPLSYPMAWHLSSSLLVQIRTLGY